MSKGVLLVNLGSPNSTSVKDVKHYLGEFLMDPNVIDLPYLLRAFIVKGIILHTRPKHSAEAYQKIWWEEGSPLIVLSERLKKKVEGKITIPVALAMRYGSMSLEKGLSELSKQGVDDVLVIPLYPQYAMATTQTIIDKVTELQKEKFSHISVSTLPAFYHKKDYIKSLSNAILETIENLDYEYILFSYHGLPERHIKKSDVTHSHCQLNDRCCSTPSAAHQYCYRHQCFETTRLVAEALQLKKGSFGNAFQSRLGFDAWLQPYTDRSIEKLGLQGIKKLVVVTPAFVSDCIETLEEIAIQGRELFIEVGGEEFTTVPCLNERDDWAQALVNWIEQWRIVDVDKAIASHSSYLNT